MKPLLVFDGNCSFCRRWVARWQRATGDRVEYAPSSEAAARLPDIPPERFKEAVVFVDAEGRVSHGAEAVFRALAVMPGQAWPLGLYRHVPGFAPLSELLYRLVARHRGPLSWLSESIWGPHLVPPGEQVEHGLVDADVRLDAADHPRAAAGRVQGAVEVAHAAGGEAQLLDRRPSRCTVPGTTRLGATVSSPLHRIGNWARPASREDARGTKPAPYDAIHAYPGA